MTTTVSSIAPRCTEPVCTARVGIDDGSVAQKPAVHTLSDQTLEVGKSFGTQGSGSKGCGTAGAGRTALAPGSAPGRSLDFSPVGSTRSSLEVRSVDSEQRIADSVQVKIAGDSDSGQQSG